MEKGSSGEPPHLLALKVMRLSRPSFAKNPTAVAVDRESTLSMGKEALIAHHSSLITTQALATDDHQRLQQDAALDFPLSNVLALPSSFGHIYLGETFSSYLCINNDSSSTVSQISLKAELQTSSQRVTLYDTSDLPHSNLITRQTIEFVVSYEIKELGVHILVCTIHYSTPSNERRFFRKFYKFQVLNPLAVKTKVNSSSEPPNSIFLEAQIQNVTMSPMYIERVRLDPYEVFSCQDLNFDSAGNSIFSHHTSYIASQDVRQYLYRLTPADPSRESAAATTATLGKLDILWRSTMGELGRLQTSQLIRKLPAVSIIEWSLHLLPERIYMESTFPITFKVRNISSEPVNLLLNVIKESMTTILACGESTMELGRLEPLSSTLFTMEFYALAEGMAKIDGLRLTERVTDSVIDNPQFQVFVQRQSS